MSSIAQQNRLKGFHASLRKRGVPITINPGEVEAKALIQVVDEVAQKRLQISDANISHVVHVLRTHLVTDDDPPAAIVLIGINEISRDDGSTATYRVKYFRDDEQIPQVEFFCKLAPAKTP